MGVRCGRHLHDEQQRQQRQQEREEEEEDQYCDAELTQPHSPPPATVVPPQQTERQQPPRRFRQQHGGGGGHSGGVVKREGTVGLPAARGLAAASSASGGEFTGVHEGCNEDSNGAVAYSLVDNTADAEEQSTKPRSPVGEPWFHGKLDRREAEALLQEDGDFLVRESTSSGKSGQYVLSSVKNGIVIHLLLVDPEGVVRTKDRTFESVSHLISHHKGNRVPILSQDLELYLIKGIVCCKS